MRELKGIKCVCVYLFTNQISVRLFPPSKIAFGKGECESQWVMFLKCLSVLAFRGDGREVVNELEQLFIFLIARIVLGEVRQPWECIRFCGLLLFWIEEEPEGESKRKGAVQES